MLLHLSCLPEQVSGANKDIRLIFGEMRIEQEPSDSDGLSLLLRDDSGFGTLGRRPLLCREGTFHIPPTADRRTYTTPPGPSIERRWKRRTSRGICGQHIGCCCCCCCWWMDGVGPTMPVFAFYSYNFRPFDLFGTIIVLLLSLNFFRYNFVYFVLFCFLRNWRRILNFFLLF